MRREWLLSIGAMVLAFLASQHHNLHMLLLSFGLGGAGMSFLTAVPSVRRAMLIMSLAMIAVIGLPVGLSVFWRMDVSSMPTRLSSTGASFTGVRKAEKIPLFVSPFLFRKVNWN